MSPNSHRLLDLLPEFSTPATDDDPSLSLVDLVTALLKQIGTEHTLCWVVDDLHWADEATRGLIGYIALTMTASRVLIATAYRTDDLELRHPVRSFVAQMSRLDHVHRIELGPFTRAETSELIADEMREQPSEELLHQRKDGEHPRVEHPRQIRCCDARRGGRGRSPPASLRRLTRRAARHRSPIAKTDDLGRLRTGRPRSRDPGTTAPR